MKKQIIIKIISSTIILGFAMFFLVTILPNSATAATDLNWDNPNKNGDNPYKVTTDAILNSQTLMQVVGCTGLVDKVSGAITNFLKTQVKDSLKSAAVAKLEEAHGKACDVAKAAVVSPTGTIPTMTISVTLADGYKCPDIMKTSSTALEALQKKANDQAAAKERREACFNGLAYTLAKNQLTSMTRETLNWVNSGFNGNPLYVQNIKSLTNSIERNVIETGIAVMTDQAFPYSGNFSKTIIKSYNSGYMNDSANFLSSLTSDLSAFLSDKDTYGLGATDSTLTAMQRAQEDNNRFADDFSVGGWDGYMALTQRDQNNPLGFTMAASQYLADRIDQQKTETKDEISQNNGFLSQKECIKWQLFDNKGEALMIDEDADYANLLVENDGSISQDLNVYSPTKSSTTPNYDKCADWKVTTPGSIIKDKLTTYINSPERQLELADTINKSLSGLFTKLIENFRGEGLFGLSQEQYSAIDDAAVGYGTNGTGVDDKLYSGNSSSTDYASGYKNDSFDLTRDLGNTYIHYSTTKIGKWNAATNKLDTDADGVFDDGELNVDLAPYDGINNAYYSSGYYYEVSTAGNTKLFSNGYNGWAVGDRAFWSGKEWQNWKKGQASPIDTRGIIQIQKDYVVAAKEILKVLPSIMPKIGELDYCIPGPNPNFENNALDTGNAFNAYAGSLAGTFDDGSFFVRNSTTYRISQPGNTLYDNYANIFKDLPTLFAKIKITSPWTSLQAMDNLKYKKNGAEERAQAAVDDLINQIQNDIKNFYSNYKTDILEGYYGTMRSEYNEREDTANSTRNSAYVPMIEDGYAITKNMVTRSEDIAEETEDYKDAIIQADSNTSKLNEIKNAVSLIVKAAQARRDKNLIEKILPTQYPGKTIAEATAIYNAEYAACFGEEDIAYYDYNGIVVDTSEESGRCADGTDNDLDGLIDTKDPDCKDVVIPTVTIKAAPSTITGGSGSSTITWSSTNATSCNLVNVDNETKVLKTGKSGTYSTGALTKSTTYRADCIRNNGTTNTTKSGSAIIKVFGTDNKEIL